MGCNGLVSVLQLIDGKQSHEDIYDFISEADWDGDGRVSFRDLARYQYIGARCVCGVWSLVKCSMMLAAVISEENQVSVRLSSTCVKQP